MVGPGQHHVVQRFSPSKLDLAKLAQDHQARYRASTAGNTDQGPGDERLQTLQSRSGEDPGGNCHSRSGCSGLGVIGFCERDRMATHFSKILYATDYSKASARALDQAVALTKQNHAELLVLHVIDPVTPYVAGEDIGGAELYMRKLMEKLRKLRVNAKSLLVRGTAQEQIVKAAKGRRANLIVIGTHGRTGLSKLLMGSVANKVVSTAHCPVLTVRGK